VSEVAIEVSEVGLAYRLSRSRSGTFKEFAIQMLKRQLTYEELWALSGVSFSVERGEVFGVIGPNGGGKSTLMKIMARVLPPTKGRVVVRGSVAPMIELGAGFNGELTGSENIIMYGTLLGRSPEAMRDRVEAIAEWAELSEFLDVPLRAYSTGMLARLGFSVATDTKPDVLIVDEVLSVGDASFQTRSAARMKELIGDGATVVIVSHDLPTIATLADRTMWLDAGSSMGIGDSGTVVSAYKRSVEVESE